MALRSGLGTSLFGLRLGDGADRPADSLFFEASQEISGLSAYSDGAGLQFQSSVFLPTNFWAQVAPSFDFWNTARLSVAPLEVTDQRPISVVAGPAEGHEVTIQAIPNDARYADGSLWGMYDDASNPANQFGSQAAEAWAQGHTGSMTNVIGVIDSGIDYTHPDLYLNIWLNQREIPTTLRASLSDIDSDGLITFRDLNGSANATYVLDYNGNGRIDAGDLLNDIRWENGVDEDANGYRDDLIGWDFVNNDNDPMDDNSHGTHVAGTMGAMGDNSIGVAGVNWSVQMAALKSFSASGSGKSENSVLAVGYFTAALTNASEAENFLAINSSWGGGSFNQNLLDAITRAAQQDVLFVAAAGNELLLKLWESLHVETHTRITLLGRGLDFVAVAESHQPLVDAIKAGYVELACRLSREHQAYFEHVRSFAAS